LSASGSFIAASCADVIWVGVGDVSSVGVGDGLADVAVGVEDGGPPPRHPAVSRSNASITAEERIMVR
jgi:hypothetical protein